jgi:hypothetical protein
VAGVKHGAWGLWVRWSTTVRAGFCRAPGHRLRGISVPSCVGRATEPPQTTSRLDPSHCCVIRLETLLW